MEIYTPVKRSLVDLIIEEGKKNLEKMENNIIVPLYKRGNKKKSENYREISLLCTAYKVYVKVPRSRLEEEMKDKGMLPESQAG